MTELLLATRSNDKAAEIGRILATMLPGVRVLSLREAGIAEDPAEDAIEAYDTFVANAHAKAAWFRQRTTLPVIADDSGLSVSALDGAPGVLSKRFAPGSATGRVQDDANNRELLRRLDGVPAAQRAAHYTCAAVLHTSAGQRCTALGTRAGRILEAPRGDGGFGYDPLFLDEHTGLTFGETSADAKNRTSHRARAFRALAVNLAALLSATRTGST